MNVTDPSFWAERLARGVAVGEPHRAVLDESPEFYAAVNAKSASVLRQVFAFFGPVASVLDVGCGLGDLCEHVPPGELYCGVDFVGELIRHAGNRHHGRWNVGFRVADARALPFADGQFGIVVCRGFEGTMRRGFGESEWLKAEAEMRRVTRTVVVSMGVYRAGRYDVIAKDGTRLRCVEHDPEGDDVSAGL